MDEQEEQEDAAAEEDFEILPPLPEPARAQFGLKTLFLVTTSVALILATGQFFGWRNLLWILPVFLNPLTIGSLLGNFAERSNRERQGATRKLLDDLRKT